MKRFKLILLLYLLFLNSIVSQSPPQFSGLIFNDKTYNEVPVQPRYSGIKYNDIPLKYSLKKYCPLPGNQGTMSSCVGWSAGYGLLTMSRAIKQKETDRNRITRLANSALFIYNQILLNPEDCSSGAELVDALQLLKKQGDCLAENFDKQIDRCNDQPSSQAKQEALYYKIKDYVALFKVEDEKALKLDKVQTSIANDKPVLVGMKLTTTFFLNEEKEVWKAEEDEGDKETYSHAMVVIGYNKLTEQFELLNSFGTDWRKGGFVKMSYDEFAKRCRYGFQVVLEDESETSSEQEERISGKFEFRHITGAKEDSDGILLLDEFGNEIPEYNIAAVEYDSVLQYYKMINNWSAGALFQLATSQVPEGKYVYVFSIGSDGIAESHYPKTTQQDVVPPMPTYFPNQFAELTIPSTNNALQLEKGEDWLVVLFCDQLIPDYHSRINKINDNDKGFSEKLALGFGDILIPNHAINFNSDKMNFKTSFKDKIRHVVGLVLWAEGL